MTRQEYLMEQVENVVNKHILPTINEKQTTEYKDQINKINLLGFLYSVNRVEPLTMLMKLARILNQEDFDKVIKEYDENYKGERK